MGNEIPRPPKIPFEAPQPAKKKTGLYIGIVLIGIIVIGAIAVIALNPSFVYRTKITRIQIKVEQWRMARSLW